MSKLVGILHGKKIYDNNPALTKLMCDTSYIPVYDAFVGLATGDRCDYCGRICKDGEECKSCGAPR